MKRPVVTIDGPAGAGKSTVTRQVAARLGYAVVDTGALYRTVALYSRRKDIDWADANGVTRAAEELAEQEAIRFGSMQAGKTQVWLFDEDVSLAIRDEEVSQGASIVSAIPGVREALLDLQRRLGRDGGVVLEGRDTGTVVFPNAKAKFFLTAAPEVRAERRYKELTDRGEDADPKTVLEEVLIRDRRDSQRPVAPLKPAADAVMVDSSSLGIAQVVERIVARVREVEQSLADAPGT